MFHCSYVSDFELPEKRLVCKQNKWNRRKELVFKPHRDHFVVFFIWNDSYVKDGFSRVPEFQRSQFMPFNGVGFTHHPRGGRLGDSHWPFPGKQTAVFMDGTLNNDKDRDRGWTVELAYPGKGMK